jgi:hypothetical protein
MKVVAYGTWIALLGLCALSRAAAPDFKFHYIEKAAPWITSPTD